MDGKLVDANFHKCSAYVVQVNSFSDHFLGRGGNALMLIIQ